MAILAAVGVAYLCILLVFSWQAAGWDIHPPAASYPWHLGTYPALKPQNISVRTQTGITIACRFFPGRTRATVVLSPGSSDTQDQMLPWADFLHRAGFSVVTYDPRGFGGSGGTTTFGELEARDLVSIVSYLSTRRDVDRRKIAALGFSLGGAVSILAAAADPRIRAVVDDSGFGTFLDTTNPSIVHALLHPRDPNSVLAARLAALRTGVDLGAIRPLDKVALISPRPIFIIQGTADTVVPPRDSAELYRAAQQPRMLWWVPGAGHGQAIFRAGRTYQRRVVRFLRQALHA